MAARLLNGFWKLTWVEAKIFAREPMGFVGTLVIPVVIFVLLGRAWSRQAHRPPSARGGGSARATCRSTWRSSQP